MIKVFGDGWVFFFGAKHCCTGDIGAKTNGRLNDLSSNYGAHVIVTKRAHAHPQIRALTKSVRMCAPSVSACWLLSVNR